jgi:hypothetical protein
MSREHDERGLSTADLVSTTQEPQAPQARQEMPAREGERQDTRIEEAHAERAGSQRDALMPDAGREDLPAQDEPLAALFDPDLSQDLRLHWSDVQIGFVDDPKRAVQQADELVALVMKRLAESFARQRAEIEAGVNAGEQTSTENLRVALRRYRSFFERLLSL